MLVGRCGNLSTLLQFAPYCVKTSWSAHGCESKGIFAQSLPRLPDAPHYSPLWNVACPSNVEAAKPSFLAGTNSGTPSRQPSCTTRNFCFCSPPHALCPLDNLRSHLMGNNERCEAYIKRIIHALMLRVGKKACTYGGSSQSAVHHFGTSAY